MITRNQAIRAIESYLAKRNTSALKENKIFVDFEHDFIDTDTAFVFVVYSLGANGTKEYYYDNVSYRLDKRTGDIKEVIADYTSLIRWNNANNRKE